MEKKLYFSLSDNEDLSGLIMEPDGAMTHILDDVKSDLDCGNDIKKYTIKPVMLTDEEYLNLPEYQY